MLWSVEGLLCLYRENDIAIESEAGDSLNVGPSRPLSRRLDRCDRVIQDEYGDSNGGNVVYVTMRITFETRKFGNVERNSHCDVLHITPVRVARLVLDCNGVFAINAYRAKRTGGHLRVRNVICIVTYTSPL